MLCFPLKSCTSHVSAAVRAGDLKHSASFCKALPQAKALWRPSQSPLGLPTWLSDKESACDTGDIVQSLVWEDPLEMEMATLPSILAWKIPCTEQSCRI